MDVKNRRVSSQSERFQRALVLSTLIFVASSFVACGGGGGGEGGDAGPPVIAWLIISPDVDGLSSPIAMDSTGDVIRVGDSLFVGVPSGVSEPSTYYGFLRFPADRIPLASTIESASLKLDVVNISGAPHPILGNLEFVALSGTTVLSNSGIREVGIYPHHPSSDVTGPWIPGTIVESDVSVAVREAAAAGVGLVIRIQFQHPKSSDSVWDFVEFASSEATARLTPRIEIRLK